MTSSPELSPARFPSLDAEAPSASGAESWLPDLAAAADADLRAALADARRAGRDDGVKEAEWRALERAKPAVAALARVTAQLEASLAALLHDRERDLHALAIATARHLVQREIAADPQLVSRLVQQALALLPVETALEIRLHPDDLAVLRAAPGLAEVGHRTVSMQWVADPQLERGDFIMESPQRLVDGRADVALRALYERIGHE